MGGRETRAELVLRFALADDANQFDEHFVDVVTRTRRRFQVGYLHRTGSCTALNVHAGLAYVEFVADEQHGHVMRVFDA